MRIIRICGIVGARPNFMKIAPIARALINRHDFTFSLIHTGQHYNSMSDPFFKELGLPKPVAHLDAGSQAGAAEQIGLILTRLPSVLSRLKPDIVLVVGDVNSTLAGAIAANKLGLLVGHVEAGLRSFDNSMPEEINRRLTDQISDFCFTPSPDANRNLRREGVAQERVYLVGNLMIDTLLRLRPKAAGSRILETLHLQPDRYILVTLHRPSNVDLQLELRGFIGILREIAETVPVVFPIHPRTLARGKQFGVWKPGELKGSTGEGLILTEPLGYLDFLALQEHAKFVMTDSGGVQEETTVLGIPCLTMRDNTERPVTISHGTNRLAGTDPRAILRHARRLLRGDCPPRRVPPLWDGRSAERLVKVLRDALGR